MVKQDFGKDTYGSREEPAEECPGLSSAACGEMTSAVAPVVAGLSSTVSTESQKGGGNECRVMKCENV